MIGTNVTRVVCDDDNYYPDKNYSATRFINLEIYE